MNDNHRPADFENLEPPLQAAVEAALAEPIPEDAIARVKSRAKQLAATGVAPSRDFNVGKRGWTTARSLIAGLTAAAALLVMATAGVLLLNYSGGSAFAQVIEKVKAAKSVRFTTSIRLGKGREDKGVIYIEDNRTRYEQFAGTVCSLADIDQKRGLILDMANKRAQVITIDADVARISSNPIEKLRRMKPDDAEKMGQEVLRGRRTQVYRCHKIDTLFGMGSGEMLVWVDAESGLPAKIEARSTDPKFPMELRLDKFVWNGPLDARLFSLAIPDGFRRDVIMETPKRLPRQAYADNPNYLTDGVLCHDQVPATIVWDSQGKTITALMRDPESVPQMERQQGALRQWDVATGKLRWFDNRLVPREWTQTADGKTLATVFNLEVELRDAATGKITRTWGTDELISRLAFSPDGKTLAAGIGEWGKYGGRGGKMWGGVQFWNVKRATLLRTIKSDNKPVQFVRYSVDGKFLATSAGTAVKLWDVSTGKLAHIFPGIHTADFSPDGRTIACQAASPPGEKNVGKVDLYKIDDASLMKSFLTDKGPSASWVTSITFSPDGRLLAATDWNGTVTLWNVASGERKLTIADHRGGVLSAAFSPDGKSLATGSEDKILCVRKLPPELTGLSAGKN